MSEAVYDAIKGWAGIYTWHTYHPLDTRRFHEAMTKLFEAVGDNIDKSQVREALIKHRSENPEGLGGKPSDEVLENHVERAMIILSYLSDEGR